MNQTRGQGDKETRGQWQFRILSHLPLAPYLLPLATRHSPLATRHSPLATRHSFGQTFAKLK